MNNRHPNRYLISSHTPTCHPLTHEQRQDSHTYLRHHWQCPQCRSVNSTGQRCPHGAELWATYQTTPTDQPDPTHYPREH